MKIKALLLSMFVLFLCFCGYQVLESGIISDQAEMSCPVISLASEVSEQSAAVTADSVVLEEPTAMPSLELTGLKAQNAAKEHVVLGSIDPESGFFFELTLTNTGAAIEQARLTGFSTRGTEDDPLVVLSPVVDFDGSVKRSLSSMHISFAGSPISAPLYKLNWSAGDINTGLDGSESVTFSAKLFTPELGDVVNISKTYKVVPGQRHIECDIALENLLDQEIYTAFDIQSAVGFEREAVRMDGRKVAVAYYAGQDMEVDRKELAKLRTNEIEYINTGDRTKLAKMDIERPKGAGRMAWALTANKYFGAIIWPESQGLSDGEVVDVRSAEYYDPKIIRGVPVKKQPKVDGSENVGFKMKFSNVKLAPASKKTYEMNMFLGPKEKSIFEDNDEYNNLGFINAVDFKMCCGNLFRPISFFILWLMKTLYYVIPNYGVIIIILVLLVRVALHPMTKKGQISMMKMSKLGPKVEEVKAKYANNKAEMNRKVMEVYREQGASPMLGFLPMMIQMPIWISLYSAINASIDLRGAKFLPFWITDLSAPDALVSFQTVTIPLVGWEISSFNLLPILLGIAMFMQQKMMPSQAAASSNPQVAQQQKMMLIMMPVMMLLFLYKAPSGLNLYIMSSVFGGVMEQRVIRKHLKEKEEQEAIGKIPVTKKTGGKVKKKKPKPFFKG